MCNAPIIPDLRAIRSVLVLCAFLLWAQLCYLPRYLNSKAHLWYMRVRIGWVMIRLSGDVLATYKTAWPLVLVVLWPMLWLLVHGGH